ncbi:NB-ARC domain containing protein [Trema orientale]|uniref:NB-ARC domain containing protein n=1 Tax=Trema orientale TaxID=63057 RepID=A0A2P5FFI6_TREOI|nr:NB-ARC domain containing protein [Trema orientale]
MVAFKRGEELEDSDIRINIGKEIVKKCGGIPLAIRTLGSMLYSKISETEWLFFRENELSKVPRIEDDGILSTYLN